MRKKSTPETVYVADPMLASAPLTMEELRALIEQGASRLNMNGYQVIHLLSRVEAAVRELRESNAQLSTLLQDASLRSQMASHPTTSVLAALDAMSDDQRATALAAVDRAELSRAQKAQQDAARAQTVALSAANRARFVVSTLLSDPRLPEDLAIAARQALEGLGAPVTTPVMVASPSPPHPSVPDIHRAAVPDPASLEELFGDG